MANPALSAEVREGLVRQLMDARRGLRGVRMPAERAEARRQVEAAKRALGERGPVWWNDGSPDYNRRLAKNSPYAAWWAEQELRQGR